MQTEQHQGKPALHHQLLLPMEITFPTNTDNHQDQKKVSNIFKLRVAQQQERYVRTVESTTALLMELCCSK